MRILLVFLPAYLMSQFFRSFLAVIAPDLQQELGLDPQQLGFISSAWFIAFAFAQFPVGWALDRIGPRRSVPLIIMCAVIGCVVFALAQSATACMVAMALIGVGCAPMYMGALYSFARFKAPAEFAVLSSWLIGFGSFGNVLAAAPLTWLAGAVGWRTSFLIIAAVTLLSAVVIALRARDPERPDDGDGGGGVLSGLWQVLRLRAIWPLVPLALVSYAVVAAERALWIAPYMIEVHGADSAAVAFWTTLMAFAMIAGALAYGPVDKLLGTRKWIAVGGSLITACLFLVLGIVDDVGISAAGSLIAAAGFFGLTYAVIMAHGRAFFPDHLVGRGITLLNFLFIGGVAIVQAVSGSFIKGEMARGAAAGDVYASMHLGFGVCLALATAVYLLAADRPPERERRQM